MSQLELVFRFLLYIETIVAENRSKRKYREIIGDASKVD